MRTVLLVLVMMVVALAAGLSFVLRAGAQEQPTATLELACRSDRLRAAIPSGVATLVTCTATTRNTGSVALAGAQLSFVPASVALSPPDAYYFWSEVRDGVPQQVGEAQLAYDLGDIAPGGESLVVLEIIVRSTHEYGADLVLTADPDRREYARTTVHGTLADGPPSIGLKLYHGPAVSDSVGYGLMILNYTGAPYDAVRVDLSPGSGVRLEGTTDWRLTSASPHLVADLGPLAADTVDQRAFTIVPAGGDCVTARPVLVVTATQGDQVFNAAAIDDGVLLNCSGAEGGGEGGGGVSAVPYAGYGPTPDRGEGRAAGAALLAGGAGALALGLALRRRLRPRAVPRS